MRKIVYLLPLVLISSCVGNSSRDLKLFFEKNKQIKELNYHWILKNKIGKNEDAEYYNKCTKR